MQANQAARRKTARQLIQILHGWIGAFACLFIFLIAAAGLALAFFGELFELEFGDIVRAQSGEWRHIAEIVEAAEQSHPQGLEAYYIYMPDTRVEGMEAVMVYGPELVEGGLPGVMTTVDPVTATYKGSFNLYEAYAHDLNVFHYSLMMGSWGEAFISIIGILLVLFVLTGIYMWWPRTGMTSGKKLVTVRTKGQLLAKFFNWHGLAGVWLGVIMILFAVTGIGLNKPEWYGPAVDRIDHLTATPEWHERIRHDCGDTVTLRQAADQALAAFPGRHIARAIIERGEENSFEFSLRKDGDWNSRYGDAHAEVHAKCADEMWTTTMSQESAPKAFGYVMRSIHGGHMFGPLAELSVILTGLALLLLSGSGVYLFLKKTLPDGRMRKRLAKKRAAKNSASTPQ